MIEKIKNIGWAGLGVIGTVFIIAISVFFIKGGVWIFEHFNDLFQTVNNWIWIIIIFLGVISVIPRIRAYTGVAIIYATYVWGATFWLLCLFVTYQFWGFIGIFLGLMMAGVGVFATAILAILFDGQVSGALFMALNLGLIYGVRTLGLWIASKHREPSLSEDSDVSLIS